MDSISAIPQNPFLGRTAQFLRYLETQNKPEFLPPQLDVMGLMAKLALPQASTVENLSYGNYPFTMPPQGTGAMIPQVKTGRKPEVADLIATFSGVPGANAVGGAVTKISNTAADALVRAITRNPQATAPGVIQETAMPFMQAVAPKAPGLLAPRSELGFYSALEEAVGPLQNKGTGTQFLAQIEKTPGVKPEEIKWTGLDDFLKSKPNVTKAEVQDYLAQNRVNLQEVRLGQQPTEFRGNALYVNNELAGEIRDTSSGYAFRTPDGQYQFLDANRMDEAVNKVKQNLGIDIPETLPTKFSSYTLPGGENYREILLTLPSAGKPARIIELENGRFGVIDADGNRLGPVRNGVPISYSERGVAEQAATIQTNREKAATGFRSSHFDQPNILAHMRVNDRVVDGKKTLFIEEVQSDWHQAGRKKGYQREKDLTPDQIDLRFIQSEVPSGADPSVYPGYYEAFDKSTGQFLGRHSGTLSREQAMRDAVMSANQFQTGVPNAPFKTTWHELSLKRAIQEASEKGYDKIAFTTGKTQAERYDLSKQVSVLRAPFDNGEYVVSYIPTGENEYRFLGRFTEKNLPNAVGKDLAEKIVANKGVQTMTYKGDDLSIGGEGMKGFYDNILPKSLEKLGKKFDAKVGKTEMDGVEVWSMDITPKMRESVLTKGQPLFAAPLIPAGLLDYEEQ